MHSGHDEEIFVQKTRSLLDESVNQIDRETLIRLRAARDQALSGRSRHYNGWLPAGGFAVAATVALLVVGLWSGTPVDTDMAENMDDLELLSANENLDFYENLEFYAWLQDEDNSG